MNDDNRKREIEAEIMKLRTELDMLNDRDTLAAASKLVGKCFTYRNCYSMPKTAADYWLVWYKCVGVDGWPVVVQFQRDKSGDCRCGKTTLSPQFLESLTPTTPAKFRQAWKKFKATAAALGDDK